MQEIAEKINGNVSNCKKMETNNDHIFWKLKKNWQKKIHSEIYRKKKKTTKKFIQEIAGKWTEK